MPTTISGVVGERNRHRTLSESDVLAIRAIGTSETQAALARRYGVTRTTIRAILVGKLWPHVGGQRWTPSRQLGPKAHNWNGGLKRKGRYMLILRPEHPNAIKGYIRRSHWIVEQAIGRPVALGEHVHHVNHDTLDDRPENLQLLTAAEHMRLHADERTGHRWHNKPLNWKLTTSICHEIRALIATGLSMKAIARNYGVSDTVVRQIRDGTHWSSANTA